jgi:signal transduction histidine kinase
LLAVAGALALGWLISAGPVSAGEPQSRPASTARPTSESIAAAEKLGIGCWIWTTNFSDKQVCRFWRAFTVSPASRLEQATLRITADNVYRLYLDGRELGLGGNWRSLSEYDLTWLLNPGRHVFAIEALNDNLEAGIILGLRMRFVNGEENWVRSDSSWRVVPNSALRWQNRTRADPRWPQAREVGVIGQPPWWAQPMSIIPTRALRPIELRFWQQGWFLTTVLGLCLVTMVLSLRLAGKLAVQSRAQTLFQQERARIARDIHDDLGAGLTQLTLQSELVQTSLPPQSQACDQLADLCAKSRSLSDVMDEIVWAVNPKRDSVQEFSSYVCTYAESFLAKRNLHCRFEVDPEMANAILDLPTRRNLLLAVKEALRNVVRHSHATEVFLRLDNHGDYFTVIIEDNGTGFDPARTGGSRNGLTNMTDRLKLIGGQCQIASMPGIGCRVHFTVPLGGAKPSRLKRLGLALHWLGRPRRADAPPAGPPP